MTKSQMTIWTLKKHIAGILITHYNEQIRRQCGDSAENRDNINK